MFRYIGYAGPLPTNGKAFATPKVVAALLPMALEGDTLEILLQNNAESIALDPQALKTCPDIRNGLLGAENGSFPESGMLSTPCELSIVTLIYGFKFVNKITKPHYKNYRICCSS